jgi:HK97 family phage major capsid protein/HK97 family phage prohead protease
MERLFATLELRATSDDLRQFEGIANTAALDSHDTVVEPLGARFTLPLPLLWFHDQETPVGEITRAELRDGKWWVQGTIRKVTEPGAVKDATDRAWHSLKHKLVRGLSVGFKPLKEIGNRYVEWIWRELSLVTLPSNQEASILAVRSAYNAASGDSKNPGVSGSPTPTPRHGKMTIAEQITQYENTRAAKIAQRDALLEKSGAEGATLDASDAETFDTLDTEVRSIDEHLVRLNRSKADMLARATAVTATNTTTASQSRGGVSVVTVKPNVEPGIMFARHVMALAVCKGNKFEAAEYAKRTWGDGADEIYRGLRDGIMTRAAVAAGTTTNSTFAAPLVPTNYSQDFLDLLRPKTLLGRIPGLRHVPFNTSMPAQTAGGTFKWVGQGKMKPVTNAQYAAVTLAFAKASGISVLTEELVRLSTPSAEAAVRDSLVKDCANFLDVQFLDSTVAAVSNVNPASITNGVTGTGASGADVADARTDIAARIKAFADANYNLDELVILMSQSMAFNLGTMVNAVGAPAFPGLGINGGSILGIPVVTGGNVGSQIVFVHAPSILMADEGGVEVDVSREASVELQDTPTEPSDASTVLTSLWQANLVGIRVERFITWGKARSTAVDRITSAAYVP